MQQPWLNPPGTPARKGVADDFSSSSATMPLRGALTVLAVVWLLLLMGRSDAIVDAAYGLPVAPGTETLISVAEGWNGLMQAFGIPAFLDEARALLASGRRD
ncbi:hypothetical protein [Roseococcus sp. YIM B11640]|uniref:hypothetical protein n=1 Tax=Roseococcus sp. YIM B11640 TaxID=3133973 RepID=UPI003C7C2BA4